MSRICLTTACAPWFELPDLIPRLKTAGYDGIEVGLTDRRWDSNAAPHFWSNNAAMLDWTAAEDEAHTLKETLIAHDLACACIASYATCDDIDRAAQAISVARILGCEFVRVRVPGYDGSVPYRQLLETTRLAYRDLNQISFETGVDSLIEIHEGGICPSASAAMRVLEGLDPTQVGVIFDPGNFVTEGYESLAMAIDILGPFLRHIHVKNKHLTIRDQARHGVAWTGTNTALNEGHIDWPWLAQHLRTRGYDGWWSIENFTAIERGEERLGEDAAWLRGVLGD